MMNTQRVPTPQQRAAADELYRQTARTNPRVIAEAVTVLGEDELRMLAIPGYLGGGEWR